MLYQEKLLRFSNISMRTVGIESVTGVYLKKCHSSQFLPPLFLFSSVITKIMGNSLFTFENSNTDICLNMT